MTKPFPNPTLEGYLLGPREVHEAGHVVIAEILGWPHNGITMDPAKASPLPDGAFAEREAFIPSDFHQWTHGDDHKQRVAAVYARILYAGRAAEIALLGRDCCGHALDYEHAREAIRWGRTGLYPAFRRSREQDSIRVLHDACVAILHRSHNKANVRPFPSRKNPPLGVPLG
jgi:hypothetical protein